MVDGTIIVGNERTLGIYHVFWYFPLTIRGMNMDEHPAISDDFRVRHVPMYRCSFRIPCTDESKLRYGLDSRS